MRREWSGIIKNRQWSEFEKLAKTEPSQDLADTVAELERGLEEKADRKALRKVLYILSQTGHEPQIIDEPQEETAEPAEPLKVGHMISPDSAGSTCFTYAIEKQGRLRCLAAVDHPGVGLSEAFEQSLALEDARDLGRKFFRSFSPDAVEAVIPAEYALSRIAAALRRQTGPIPSSIPYWRSIISTAEDLPHPTATMVPAETTPEQRRSVPMRTRGAIAWSLELGSVVPLVEELSRSEESGVQLTDEQRTRRFEAIYAKARNDLFTPEIVAEHSSRLRDLAYLHDVTGLPEAGLLLSTANDLDERAANSEYAVAMLEKTVAVLIESWRHSSGKKPPAMRRFDW